MLVFVISAVVSTGVALAVTVVTTAASLVIHGTVATVRLGYRLVHPSPPASASASASASVPPSATEVQD